jgi:hypothetical protein
MEAWISLKKLLDELDSETDYGSLDRMSQRGLEWIARRSQTNEPLFVQEIVMNSNFASPATVHKVIWNLERMNLIKVSVDPQDQRRRIVEITVQADKLLSKLSKAVEDWKRSGIWGSASSQKK